MDDLTYSIQKQTRKDENQTSAWLKQNGISPEHFAETKIYLLQAQKVATNLLKNHAKLLEQNQAHTLNNYLQAMTNNSRKQHRAIATHILRIKQLKYRRTKTHKLNTSTKRLSLIY